MDAPTFLEVLMGLAGFLALIAALWALVRRVRRGGKGVVLFASLLGFGAIADPLFERQIRAVREARNDSGGQDESGEPPNPDDPSA